ncbi:MAG: hypothetical protein QXF05_05510, partial [Thermofilaceae archaeon]
KYQRCDRLRAPRPGATQSRDNRKGGVCAAAIVAHVLFSKDSLHNDSERNLSYLRYSWDDINILQRAPSPTAPMFKGAGD